MKNWIIRHAKNGSLAGYAREEERTFRCKVPDVGGITATLVIERCGKIEEIEIQLDGNEHVWPRMETDEGVEDVYIVQNEMVLYETGKRPRAERIGQKRSRQVESRDDCVKSHSEIERENHDAELCVLRKWPEIRWPAPVCCPNAKYEKGLWRDRE